jgi:hypothetical protein
MYPATNRSKYLLSRVRQKLPLPASWRGCYQLRSMSSKLDEGVAETDGAAIYPATQLSLLNLPPLALLREVVGAGRRAIEYTLVPLE